MDSPQKSRSPWGNAVCSTTAPAAAIVGLLVQHVQFVKGGQFTISVLDLLRCAPAADPTPFIALAAPALAEIVRPVKNATSRAM